MEQRSQREQAKEKDINAFNASRALEKQTERERAKKEDIQVYNISRALEKKNERIKAKANDVVAYRKSRAVEKQQGREKTMLIENTTMEGRNRKFRESVRYGRQFSCICCERLLF